MDEHNVLRHETTIPINNNGLPIFLADVPARLDVRCCQTENGCTEIDIAGSERALLALAEILIGIAKTPGYHVHLGDGLPGESVAFRNRALRVIIGNTDRPVRRAPPSEPPPDWARG